MSSYLNRYLSIYLRYLSIYQSINQSKQNIYLSILLNRYLYFTCASKRARWSTGSVRCRE